MTNPVGRPKKEIDLERVKKYCESFCTQEEIINFLDVDKNTLKARLRDAGYDNFSQFYKKYSAGGKISLRRKQIALAEKNAAMAIWCGKQYLGQRDIPEDIENVVMDNFEYVLEKAVRKYAGKE